VPVLVLPSGQVLEQSLDIMQWALVQHDPEGWLTPTEGSMPNMLALIAECDGPFKQALDQCKYPSRYPGSDAAQALAHAEQWLQALEARLARQPFLFGRHAALADMAIAPFVRQFAGIDAVGWASRPWPHLQNWLAQWQESRLFDGVMHKLAPWVDGTQGVVFPCAQA